MTSISDGPIYSDHHVTISNALAMVNGVTYPLHSISSLRVVEQAPRVRPLLIVVAGVLGLIGIRAGMSSTAAVYWFFVAACVFFAYQLKPTFRLVVVSAGQEGSWIETSNYEYVDNIRKLIEKAIEREAAASHGSATRA